MPDVAYAIHTLVPGAVYFGSVSNNTEESYNAIRWEDEREKPTWAEIIAIPDPSTPLADRLAQTLSGLTNNPAISSLLTIEQATAFSKLRAYLKVAGEDWPEPLFAQMAKREIQEFPALPPQLESERQLLIDMCNEVIPPA
jgi:hypothetical protein